MSPHPLHRLLPTVTCALLLVLPVVAHADVYGFVDENGSSHFSDSPTDARYTLLYREPAEPSDVPVATQRSGRANTVFEREIQAAAQSSQVEAALLRAVIAVESNFNPRAVSPKGALGLMQLMPATARAHGVTDALNAQQNIQAGAQHLRMLLDRFSNNKVLALAAYNAGLGAVLAHGGQVPPFAETCGYVPAVLQRYQQNLVPTSR
jgi:soluble lytic murein transglycosylase-like protein